MISRIRWKNHSVLGNLELDFRDENSKPYTTIILAGENGTGKTTVLDTLSEFLCLGSITPFDYIEYLIEDDMYKVFYEEDDGHGIGLHKRYSYKSRETNHVFSNKYNDQQSISEDTEDIRHYGVSYSKAKSIFKTNPIKSSTTEQVDDSKYNSDGTDDFTNVKQLLVDLSSQDNSRWMQLCEGNPNWKDNDLDEFKRKDSKLYRFKNAFNKFFDRLQFDRVDETDASEKAIIFKKGEKSIKIDSLSTGEKQIVFRGTQLLRNMNSIKDGIVLIDEPELSMHPRWQEKILDYYRGLFIVDNEQIAQMIFATHSEYVIRKALQDRQNILIIVLYEENGEIKARKITKPFILPSVTAAETNYLAFNIISADYHIQLYGYLQTLIKKEKIKACDEYIKKHKLFDDSKHGKPYEYKGTKHVTRYETLCTYIRNTIDHPDSGYEYSEEELKTSIELLIELCKDYKSS